MKITRLFLSLAVTASLGLNAQIKERKVLFIGIDGLRSDALQTAATPHMDSLFQAGIYTYDSWHLGITSSGPSWSSMLTGVWEAKHGITNNSYSGANFTTYPYFPHLIKDVNPSSKAVQIITWNQMDDANKNTGGYVTDAKWNLSIDAGTHGQGLVTAAAKIQFNDPDLDVLFIHYDECDAAGHGTGFTSTSTTYMNAIQRVDSEIGEVIDALKKRANYANEDWLILGTTDHGGQGYSHGGQSNNERHIWWFATSSQGTLAPQKITGSDPGSYQMTSNPVDPAKLAVTPVLTDITVTAVDWALPFDKPDNHPEWALDGKSWLPDSVSILDTTSTIGKTEHLFVNSFTVFPNPSAGTFYLKNSTFGSTPSTIRVMSLTGRVVFEGVMDRAVYPIETNDWATGIYLLEAQSEFGKATKKIIKK